MVRKKKKKKRILRAREDFMIADPAKCTVPSDLSAECINGGGIRQERIRGSAIPLRIAWGRFIIIYIYSHDGACVSQVTR